MIVGCGYVGAALANLLVARCDEVWGLRRTSSPNREGIHYLTADVSRPDTLRWPEELDGLVYAVSADTSTEEAYRAAYVSGLGHVLHTLREQGQRPRVIFVSSTGVYHQDDGSWLNEDSPTQPRGFSGRLLLEGESLLHASGLPATVVRLSGIYGPGRERLIDSVRHGSARRVRDSKAVLNHIHRDDCAGAIAHVLSLPNAASLYLATDNEPAYKNEILVWIAQQCGVEAPPEVDAEPNPTIHRGGHRFYSNQRLRDCGYHFQYPTYREGYRSLIGTPNGE